jgi:hypothetical protein
VGSVAPGSLSRTWSRSPSSFQTSELNRLPVHNDSNCTAYSVSNDIYLRHESNFSKIVENVEFVVHSYTGLPSSVAVVLFC